MVALIKEEKKRCVPASLPVQYLPFFLSSLYQGKKSCHSTNALSYFHCPLPPLILRCRRLLSPGWRFSHVTSKSPDHWPFCFCATFFPLKSFFATCQDFHFKCSVFPYMDFKKKHAPTKRPMECRPPLITLPPLTGSDLSRRALCSQQSRALSPRYLYTVWGTSAGSERSSCVCSLSLQQAGLSAKDSLGAGSGTHSQL